MRILFSIAGLEFGGSEVFMLRISRMLAMQHKVILINTRPDVVNEKLLKSGLGAHVTLINTPSYTISKIVPFFKKLNSKFALAYKIDTLFLKIVLKFYNIDVVCSFKYESDVFICSALKTYNIPIVVSTRGCYSLLHHALLNEYGAFNYFKAQTVNAFSRANGLIWLTQKNIDVLKEIGAPIPDQTIQIYNGYQSPGRYISEISRATLEISEDAIVFGMVARGIEEKGWQSAIDGFITNQNETAHDIHLILVGDGPCIAELKRIHAHNKGIHFVGNVENPVQYITLFDVALLPTWFAGESIPNSVVEYLYCNKPVISTNWVEIPSMLLAGTTIAGFIIPITEAGVPDQKEMVACMKKYILDKSLIAAHSIRAKQAFEKFSMELCAEKYLHFFQNVKNENPAH